VSLTGIDHIVIMFPELDEAIRSYTRLGFTVVPGGEHPGGTHNALVAFTDGAYLELIAFKTPNPEHRWWTPAQAGGGLIDFCLATNDLAADLAAFRRAGAQMADPTRGARRWPDGYEVAWRLAVPEGSDRFQVPFLIEDITPRTERVPAATQHANGVSGVDTLSLAVRDLDHLRAVWSGILGVPGRTVNPSPGEAHAGVRYAVGAHTLEFLSPTSAASPLADRLATRGPSPHALALRAFAGMTETLDERATGARIRLLRA